MKPGSFAVLLLFLVLLFGAVGGAVGYLLHAPYPFANSAEPPQRSVTELIRGVTGEEPLRAAYEDSRRKWAGTGLGGGALLGLLSGVAIGSYSLRYRSSTR